MFRAQWVAWRNALLASPAFQRWAAAFPLTRPIAHARADALFDLVAGFVYAQVLWACVRIGLFEALAAGPRSAAAIAQLADLPIAGAERLLAAAASLGLVERVGDGFALGPHGAALRGNAGLADMISHHAAFYADLADPLALLRAERPGALAAFWPYATADRPTDATATDVGAYSALMAATQPVVAGDVLDAYDFRRHRRLLDVGGGEGAFLEAVGARWPHLELALVDLPAVTERARARFAAAGLAGRSTIHAGDFLSDALPGGADVISLIRVLHDQSEAGALALLKAVHAALPVGGVVLVAEPMARRATGDRMADAYFAFYFLAMGRGRIRQISENMRILQQAGFRSLRAIPARNPLTVQVLVAGR
jgi:demethylspheroidene O-methyltransferase